MVNVSLLLVGQGLRDINLPVVPYIPITVFVKTFSIYQGFGVYLPFSHVRLRLHPSRTKRNYTFAHSLENGMVPLMLYVMPTR